MPVLSSIIFDLNPWKALLGVALFVLSAFLYRRTFPPVGRARRLVLACLRIAGFGLLLAFVLNPVSVSVRSEVRRPLVVALFDVSRSMGVRDHGGASRWEEATEALRRFDASVRETGDAETAIIPFAGDLAPGPVPADSVPRAEGDGTDILRAIETAQMRFRSRNLAGMVLFSDGRISRGMSSTPMNIAVPVFAVGFGDTLEGRDVAVERILYERVAYVGTAAEIECIVRAVGFADASARVQLEENGKVLDSDDLEIRDASTELTARLSFLPEAEGERNLTIRVIPPAGDGREENNAESIRVRVLEQRLQIAYIDEFADWNTTFIIDIGRRSPRFEIETVTHLPGRGFMTMPDRRPWNVPSRQSDFERYDLIIISDGGRQLPLGERAGALDAYIQAGGGLLILADENTPLRSLEAANLLEAVLPVAPLGQVMVQTGEFFVAPSSEKPEHPIAALFSEHSRGEDLPPLPARLTNLAVTAAAEVPLVMSDGKETVPFCAIQRRGRGVTAVVLGFPLWWWRLAGEGGQALYQALVGGLIQYLAEGVDAPLLDLMTDRSTYRTGEEIGLTVYTRESRFLDGVRGEVIRVGGVEGEVTRTFLFEPEPRRDGYFRAVLDPLQPGEYRIAASEVRDGEGGFSGEARIAVEPVSVEFLRTSRDNGFLRYVADVSGGAVIEPGGVAGLPNRLSLSSDRVERREVRSLRQSLALFLFIIGVFGAEWVLRKVWGLV